MKLTARDKKLLMGLGIFIFIVLFVKFLLLPKLDNITTLNADINTLNNTYATNLVYKTKTESIDSNIKIISEKLADLREIYPPSINSDELLIIMKELVYDSKLEVTSMLFERAKPTNLQSPGTETNATKAQGDIQTNAASSAAENGLQAQQQKDVNNTINNSLANGTTSNILNYLYLWGLKSQQDTNNADAIVIPDGKGYSVNVKIDAQGTNEEIKSFLSSLGELNNRAYCKTSSIAEQSNGQKDASERKLKFLAEIEFYGIMDKGAGEYYMLPDGKWMPIAASGKNNIFEPYSGYTQSVAVDNLTENSSITPEGNTKNKNDIESTGLGIYDFSAVAAPFGGGLAPSVALVCKNPEDKMVYANPVVYGDNKGIENAELFIEVKGGRYYCKFKTDHESYPNKEYSQTFEFIPSGKDLKFVIISSPRSNAEDKAGINISIINNTNKKLIYEIRYEDEKLPRVKIDKTVGSVSVKK